jgi:hypothetical protein
MTIIIASVAGVVILFAVIVFLHMNSGNGRTQHADNLPSKPNAAIPSQASADSPPQPSVDSPLQPAAELPIQHAAEWASQPVENWPQLVLTNVAFFTGHTPLVGGSSFLIQMPDGQVVMGSAKHLLTEMGGVTPAMTLSDLDASLTQWRIAPHNTKGQVIKVKGIAETLYHEGDRDWLLMNLASAYTTLPCTPLRPRLNMCRLVRRFTSRVSHIQTACLRRLLTRVWSLPGLTRFISSTSFVRRFISPGLPAHRSSMPMACC